MARKKKSHRLTVLVSNVLYDQLTILAEKNKETKSDFVRQALVREIERRKGEELEKAAGELASRYEMDEDLLAFTSLDNEEYMAANQGSMIKLQEKIAIQVLDRIGEALKRRGISLEEFLEEGREIRGQLVRDE